MAVVFKKPSTLTDAPLHYCPGCTHGIIHRLVAEAIEELGIDGKTVGVASVGCSVMCYDYFTCDMVQAPHGRAQAVATGIKRAKPEDVVFTYQGDGDLAAIGTAETVHAATRGENITVIFVNNAIYGMTGGQMAPTSLPNQVTQTTPYGRDVNTAGYPVRICEMLSTLDGVALAQRVTVDNVKNVNIAKKAIKKAFQNQIEGKGYSIVEVNIVFAGFGGQGILFAGKVVAYAGLIEGRELSWLPSYGPEMRGGTANCSICLSDEPIGSPLVTNPNVLIAMNRPSLDKFVNEVEPGGTILLDSSLIDERVERDDVTVFYVPASKLAEENGLKGLANIILVGKLRKELAFCTEETLDKALQKCIPARKADMLGFNRKALEIGKAQ